jgi:AcrR family transcriptional regulator
MHAKEPARKRLRNAARTRADILIAAASAFSRKGYADVRLSDIAYEVGVNAAMVIRYFATKENLYREALAAQLQAKAPSKPEDVVDFIVRGLYRDPGEKGDPVAMMALSLGDAQAKATTERVLIERIMPGLEDWLTPGDAKARAALILALYVGFTIYRDLLPLPGLQGSEQSSAERWVRKSLQELVYGIGFDASASPETAACKEPASRKGSGTRRRSASDA